MAFTNNLYNSLHCNEELFDFDEDEEFYPENQNQNISNTYEIAMMSEDEDTDEASETEYLDSHKLQVNTSNEPLEIKEQMYQDKLTNLKNQLEELKNGMHPEFIRRVKKLETQYKERLLLNDIFKDYLIEVVERDYANEKKEAIKELEEKRADLRENLVSDFEDKRKLIESERYSMELIGDSVDVKPLVTRKLRRRPNEPAVPVLSEKRRKTGNGQSGLVLLLEDKEIESDLKSILRSPTSLNGAQMVPNNDNFQFVETKIEDGKLLYERRWFHRGQPVYIEGRDDVARFAATISAIGTEVIWVKKIADGNKIKIYTSQLCRGNISIKRRAN